jgi:hypothetical protein
MYRSSPSSNNGFSYAYSTMLNISGISTNERRTNFVSSSQKVLCNALVLMRGSQKVVSHSQRVLSGSLP